jgi:hypothetical protein
MSGLPSNLERNVFDAFAFQGPEKGFGDRIIVTVASTTHTDSNTDIREQGSRLHHWYIAIPDPNETASQLAGSDQAMPSGKPAQ